jgi:hypothetical protein
MHIGRTKMRILSIFAGKTKTMKIKQNQLKITQNQHFYMLCVPWGDGVANNLNDASHLPHLAEYLLILYCTCCELTEGSPTPQFYLYIVDPVGTVTTRDSANSQTCRKWGNVWNLVKLHTLVKIREFCIWLYVYYTVMFSKMRRLLSFKFFTSSKMICTATCPWYYNNNK